VADRKPHGRGDRDYMDVFTACLEHIPKRLILIWIEIRESCLVQPLVDLFYIVNRQDTGGLFKIERIDNIIISGA